MTLPLRWALIPLNFWMNWPGLTPCWPSAGPIGGAGVAVPPGAWSLNWTVISFFAMVHSRAAFRRLSLNYHSLDDRRIDSLATLTFERIDDRLRLCAWILTASRHPLQ